MQQRISIITLGVMDLSKSRNFYERLGWKVASEKGTENIVAFNLQSFVLALYPLENLAKEVSSIDISSKPQQTFTLAYNVHSEHEVDQTIAFARQIGAKIIKEPQRVFWGGYSAYFADRDGYLWEVAYNPFAKLAENGAFTWE